MKITNKHKLPKTIVNAIKQVQSEYSGGTSNISASGITDSPRIYWLNKRHTDKQEDAADLIWSLVGTLMHLLLERAAAFTDEAQAEERLFKEVLGWTFSGQYDLIEGDTLYDYKLTGVWAVQGEPKEEWIAQANMNRLLLHEHGVEINHLAIIAILRDWSKAKSEFTKDYPKTQVKKISLPVWTLEESEQYLRDKITLLQSFKDTPDDELPICTEKERWAKPTKYAVMKDKKAKRASKVFDSRFEAEVYRGQIGGVLEARQGEDTRCKHYCSVNQWCKYWRENAKEIL